MRIYVAVFGMVLGGHTNSMEWVMPWCDCCGSHNAFAILVIHGFIQFSLSFFQQEQREFPNDPAAEAEVS